MILQALCDFYDNHRDSLPAFGFAEKPIPFIIVLDEEGRFVDLEISVPQSFRVPRPTARSGARAYKIAYCLWDHFGYVANQPKLEGNVLKNEDMARKQHDSFKKLVNQLHTELPTDEGVNAVQEFLGTDTEIKALKAHALWGTCLAIKGCNLSFRLESKTALVCQSDQVIDWVKHQPVPSNAVAPGICLVTGEKGPVLRLHPAITGLGVKSIPLVSVNRPAFESYGQHQAFTAPVCPDAAFRYSTALNYLLRRGATTKFLMGETRYVCWTEAQEPSDNALALLLSDTDVDPDKRATEIRQFLQSFKSGRPYFCNEGTLFILGLALNSARIAVRFFGHGTASELFPNVAQWFMDIDIVGRETFGYPTLTELLSSTALKYKIDKVPPKLPPAVIQAVLTDGRYPRIMLRNVLQRITAERGHVNFTRASLIKAYLNREFYYSDKPEVSVMLDQDDTRQAYRLGCLFAIYEKVQRDAIPGIKTTIRSRYYTRASTMPKSVFGALIKLNGHHMQKLSYGHRIAIDKKITKIMALIDGFPTLFNLDDQALFAIGYYHQKNDLYTKREENAENEEDTPE